MGTGLALKSKNLYCTQKMQFEALVIVSVEFPKVPLQCCGLAGTLSFEYQMDRRQQYGTIARRRRLLPVLKTENPGQSCSPAIEEL